MAALDDATREHEEYRLRLEAEKEIRLAGIDVQRQVAEAQAKVLAAGLEKANIDIVGGDSGVLRPAGRLDHARARASTASSSTPRRRAGARGAVAGRPASFADDLSRLLGSVSTGDVQNLTLSALLLQLMQTGGARRRQLQQLLDKAGELGSPTPRDRADGRKA